MRYWGYFAAKLIVAGGLFYGLLTLMGSAMADPAETSPAPAAASPAKAKPPSKVLLLNLSMEQKNAAEQSPFDFFGELAKNTHEVAPLTRGGHVLAVNLAFMLLFLASAGTLYLIVRDQRYRCRVCLRRLRMPVETGSWGSMLQLGRPRVEYICPYGHGTLKQEEYQISALENPQWTRHSDDMWDELCASAKEAGDQK